jgi:hypothetical protein
MRGAGQTGIAVEGSSPLAAESAKSFRAGWQSLLASMGSSVDALDESEAGLSRAGGSGVQAKAETAASTSGTASTLTAGAGLDQRLGLRMEKEEKGGETGVGTTLSLDEVQTGASTVARRAAAETLSTKLDSTGQTKAAEAQQSTSIDSARSSSTVKKTKTHQQTTDASAGVVPAAIDGLVPAVVSQVSPSFAAQSADRKNESARTEVTAELSIGAQTNLAPSPGSTFSSGNRSARNSENLNEAAGSGCETAQKSVAGSEESANRSADQGLKQQISSPESSSSPAHEPAELPNSQQNLTSSAMTAGKQLAIPAPGQGLAAASPQIQNTKEIRTASQDSTQPSAVSQATAQPLMSAPVAASALIQSQQQVETQTGAQATAAVATAVSGAEASRSTLLSGVSSAASSTVAKAGSGSSGKSTMAGGARAVHGASGSGLVEHGKALVEGQSSGSVADAAATVRDPAGAQGAAAKPGDLTEGKNTAASGSTPGDTFSALDAESGAGKPTWIHAGAQQAEAGYQDPALGWVGVRADASGGGIRAELLPSSADAAQALGSHLEGLNTYLAEHHTPVATLTLSSPGGWVGSDGSQGGSQGNGQGGGQGMQQGTGQQTAQSSEAGFSSSPASGATAMPAAASNLTAWSAGQDSSAPAASTGGAYISVMA